MKVTIKLVLLLVAILLLLVANLFIGTVKIPVADILRILLSAFDSSTLPKLPSPLGEGLGVRLGGDRGGQSARGAE